MPVLVLLTGAAIMYLLEYRLQVHNFHEILLLSAFVATITGGLLVLTTRLFWGWWK
jgi:hypothetical protein